MANTNLRRSYPLWFILPAFMLFVFFFILPNVSSLFLGFTDWTTFYLFDMRFNGLSNFIRLFNEPVVLTALFNTLYFTLFMVVVQTIVGLVLALLVNRGTKGEGFFRTVFFLPVTMNAIVIAIIFAAIYNPQNGVINVFLRTIGLGALAQEWLLKPHLAMTCICLMTVWQCVGFTMVVFLAGLKSIPQEFIDAAKVDGAQGFRRLWHIVLPLLMPAFSINLTLQVSGSLKVFAQVYGLTKGGPMNSTQVMGTYLYKSFSDGYLGYSSAVGLLFTLFIMLISFSILRLTRKMEVEY